MQPSHSTDLPLDTIATNDRILVADEDPALCDQIRNWPEPVFEVVTAHDGADALELALSTRPLCALLGASMPTFSGIGVAWMFRNDPRYATIPTILIKAEGQEPADPASPDDHEVWVDELAVAEIERPVCKATLFSLLALHTPQNTTATHGPNAHSMALQLAATRGA